MGHLKKQLCTRAATAFAAYFFTSARNKRRFAIAGAFWMLLVCASPAGAVGWDQGRKNNPLQFQVGSWLGGAEQSIGYHLSDKIYLGVTQVGSHSQDLTAQGSIIEGQSGAKSNHFEFGARSLLNIRFTPQPLGVYLGLDYMQREEDRVTQSFATQTRLIGFNEYRTGMDVTLTLPRHSNLTYALGINHVSSFGLSWHYGLSLGIWEYPDLTVTASKWTEEKPSKRDIAQFEAEAANNYLVYGEVSMFMGMGWNF